MNTKPIFAQTPNPQPTQISLTREATLLRSKVMADSREGYRRLCELQKQGINRIWHHPRLTPQQAVDALGTDAVRIFQAHGALTDAIIAVAALDGVAPDILRPSHNFTAEADGSIIVSEVPYASPGD
ncbi:MAG: hypothetical protein RLZZ245_2421 [Verrucomicrobiota bacterium]|jgi:hypothetical protein